MEIWKDITGYENRYMVSDMGRVKSLPKYVTLYHGGGYWTKEKILIPRISEGYNYFMVALFNDGVRTDKPVHRLVAEAFIPNPDAKPEVNHKGGNKKDNRAIALEWVTHQENTQHAYDTGLMKCIWAGHTGLKHPGSKEVRHIQTGEVMCVKEAARVAGVSNTHMTSMLKNTRTNWTNFVYN